MRNLLLICFLTLISLSVRAHNPLTAKVELNTTLSEGGLLNIYLTQAGFHQALVQYFDQTDFSAIAELEYKKLAVQYVKEHIHINADDTPLVIGEGAIKLGSHQTDLKFLIENYPKNTTVIQANIEIGKENENHHTVFWWLKKDTKTKVVLSERNNFQAMMDSNNLVAIAETNFHQKTVGVSIGILLLLFGLIFLLYRKLSKAALSELAIS